MGGGGGSELQGSGEWGRKGVNLIITFPERLAIDTGHQASVLQEFLICRGEWTQVECQYYKHDMTTQTINVA